MKELESHLGVAPDFNNLVLELKREFSISIHKYKCLLYIALIYVKSLYLYINNKLLSVLQYLI